ncbi:MAG: Cys-Gln thioester bond-forming surface protein [Bacilli bacterium]|mgnify:CR=1 FL=1|nr:Cys-Gln thioester bond-forming surface protein [Bacilli bacterium]
MSSKNNKKSSFRDVKMDKQSSASIVLAFTVVCFMFTMFMITNDMGVSYAAPTDAPPSTLTFNGRLLTNAGGTKEIWSYMAGDNSLPLTFDFKATDGAKTYDMYCIEKQIGVSGSATYSNPEKMSSNYAPGLAFILNNSYPQNPSSTYTAICGTDDNCKKYIAQYAIWYYLDLMGIKDTNGKSNLTTEEFNKITTLSSGSDGYAKSVVYLANSAVSYNSKHQLSPAVSVDTKNISFTVVEDGKYLESSEIVVGSNDNDNFKSYTVNISGENKAGAFVTDISGTSMNTFGKGVNFKLRIPIDKLGSIDRLDTYFSISASFLTDVVYAYTPTSGVGTEQRPIITTFTNTSVLANVPLNILLTEFSKSDITNGKPVVGAVLVITDASGAEIARWTTDGNKHYVNLGAGDYQLTEITSPDGYELNKESVPFTVKDDGTITKVEMKNTPTTDVPNTAANIPLYLYIIGAMILVIGAGVIYVTTRGNKSK